MIIRKKTIMNIFICERFSPHWTECVSIFKSLNLPTSTKISGAHHRGLAFQILLDIDIKKAREFCIDILLKFPVEPLIVIAEVMVKPKNEPIGHWYDDDLVEPGRYFDMLIKRNETGVFIYNFTE
jgi:hypothetical protein